MSNRKSQLALTSRRTISDLVIVYRMLKRRVTKGYCNTYEAMESGVRCLCEEKECARRDWMNWWVYLKEVLQQQSCEESRKSILYYGEGIQRDRPIS